MGMVRLPGAFNNLLDFVATLGCVDAVITSCCKPHRVSPDAREMTPLRA